jgi:hypothetical protein
MQSRTEIGVNHSGMRLVPETANKMLENTELTKPKRGDERELAKLRMEYAKEADPVGSMPDPNVRGVQAILMDKLGERLAFERSGTRLYDALIAKCRANPRSSVPIDELQHIRDEEAEHFTLMGSAIQSLGGDPTAQTPAADVTGVEGMGFMQVLSDPKTTVAQALHAILAAELIDNVAWSELIELTNQVGSQDLVGRFVQAGKQEGEHLEKVSRWYKAATMAVD